MALSRGACCCFKIFVMIHRFVNDAVSRRASAVDRKPASVCRSYRGACAIRIRPDFGISGEEINRCDVPVALFVAFLTGGLSLVRYAPCRSPWPRHLSTFWGHIPLE